MLPIITWALTIFSAAQTSLAFTSFKAVEAELQFNHWVELEPGLEASPEKIRDAIENQLRFMTGAMAGLESPSAPRLDHTLSNIQVYRSPNGKVQVHYRYNGKILVQSSHQAEMTFPLPIRPWEIYDSSIKDLRSWKENPCTDEYFPEKKFFHYFWSPARKQCQEHLRDGVDYLQVSGSVRAFPNVILSYPEYERLPDELGRLAIHLIVEKNDDMSLRKNPMDSTNEDANAIAFRKMARTLKRKGFVMREWPISEVKKLVPMDLPPFHPYPFVLEFHKAYVGTRAKEIVIRMVFAGTESKGRTTGISQFVKDAARNSAVMIWDGHSGVGHDCGLPEIKGPLLDPSVIVNSDRYQIFQFNTCSSYSYYNAKTFSFKPSARQNLDIITAGLETPFVNGHMANLVMIEAAEKWVERGRRTSYQTLTRRMENQNLVSVSGDEDNSNCAQFLNRAP